MQKLKTNTAFKMKMQKKKSLILKTFTYPFDDKYFSAIHNDNDNYETNFEKFKII